MRFGGLLMRLGILILLSRLLSRIPMIVHIVLQSIVSCAVVDFILV